MTVPIDPQPQLEPAGQPQPTSPRGFRRSHLIAIAAGALVLVIAGGVATLSLLSGSDDPPAGGEEKITIRGTMTLDQGDFIWGANGNSDRRCSGRGGYDDIHGGAQVTVTDADGKVIALGRLDEGKATVGSDQRATKCTFAFSVEGVPPGVSFYGVEVSHRGVLRYSEADIRSRLLEFTLGG